MSIRHKILGLVVFAAVLPTTLVGSISYWTARSTLMEKLSDQLDTRSSLAAAKISDWLQERRNDARIFADSAILTSNMEAARAGSSAARDLIDRYLKEVDGRYGLYRTLAVLDERGRVLADAGRSSPVDLKRLEGLELHDAAELQLRDDSALLWLSSPVRGEGGATRGRLVLVCEFVTLRERVAEIQSLGRYRLTSSKDRVLLEHPSPAAGFVGPSGRNLQDGQVVELRDGRGIPVLATTRAVHDLDLEGPLVLTVMLDRELAFASVSELRGQILVLSALAVLLVVTLAYGLVAGLIQPLERLTESARAVARGEYGEGLPIEAHDELGYLTEVFNQMTSALKKNYEHLEQLSTTDELTKLSNRRELQNALEEELGRAKRIGHPLAVIMIDIDHFKTFNDQFGHVPGDELLANLGSYLRSSLPEGALAARYGGDEFLVILPETTTAQASETAETLRVGFSNGRDAEKITLSLGVASCTGCDMTAAELVDAADRALYRAKAGGRDRVVASTEASDSEAEEAARSLAGA